MILRNFSRRFGHQIGVHRTATRIHRDSKNANRALNRVETSGVHDHGRLANEDDLFNATMLTRTRNSVPVLSFRGIPIWDGSDWPIHITAPPGSMKGMALLFPMMASWPHSLFAIDVGYEAIRALTPMLLKRGTRVISIAPSGKHGFPAMGWGLLKPFVKAVMEGCEAEALGLARRIANIILPHLPGDRNEWIRLGGVELIIMCLFHLADNNPEECTLSNLWVLLTTAPKKVLEMAGDNARRPIVLRRALKFVNEYNVEAHKQLFWKFETAADALNLLEPESVFASITSRDDFRPSEAKSGKQPVAIFLALTGAEMEAAGPITSIMISLLLEELAEAEGDRPVLCILDELAQLPRTETVMKTVRVYRKRRMKCVTVTQSRKTLDQKWGEGAASELEANAGINVWMDPEPQVSGELERKSGTRTALGHGVQTGESASNALPEHQVSNLPFAVVSNMSADQAILEVRGLPGLVVADRTPWWNISPLNVEISDAYRDDHFQFDPGLLMDQSEALAMFGLSPEFTRQDVYDRAALLQGRFSADLIARATDLLIQSTNQR